MIVFGTSIQFLPSWGWRQIDLLADEVIRIGPSWQFRASGGVLEQVCNALTLARAHREIGCCGEFAMPDGCFGVNWTSVEYASLGKRALVTLLLALFWCWETWRPYFGQQEGRIKHAARNLAIALFNTAVLSLAFGSLTLMVMDWTERHRFGLLNAIDLGSPARFVAALVLLDGWMYVWHRANHTIPFLWRFHRMHHSDRHMDVTTATRFHLGEHVGAVVLRLGLIPLLGFEAWNLLIYEALVIASTQLHHADISLGRWDRWLRLFIVSPDMHKVHHSDLQNETDSNYSTVLSVWDRLARTLRMRSNPKTIVFGLTEFTGPAWQGCWGMLKTPFVNPTSTSAK